MSCRAIQQSLIELGWVPAEHCVDAHLAVGGHVGIQLGGAICRSHELVVLRVQTHAFDHLRLAIDEVLEAAVCCSHLHMTGSWRWSRTRFIEPAIADQDVLCGRAQAIGRLRSYCRYRTGQSNHRNLRRRRSDKCCRWLECTGPRG